MRSALVKEGAFFRLLLKSSNKLRKIIILEATLEQIQALTEVLLNLDLCSLKACKKLQTVKKFLKRKKFSPRAARKFFIKNIEFVCKLVSTVLSKISNEHLSCILVSDEAMETVAPGRVPTVDEDEGGTDSE